MRYDWPGNIRELQNVIERAVILARGAALKLDVEEFHGHLAASSIPDQNDSEVIPDGEWRERERANLLTALREANYRVSGKGGAAELPGINPGTLASRLRALGISRPRS
jgi:transcriptional regulator with GAF, ATPase, and Fis domain